MSKPSLTPKPLEECLLSRYAVSFMVPVTVFIQASEPEDAKALANQYRLVLRDEDGMARESGWQSGFPQEITVTEIN